MKNINTKAKFRVIAYSFAALGFLATVYFGVIDRPEEPNIKEAMTLIVVLAGTIFFAMIPFLFSLHTEMDDFSGSIKEAVKHFDAVVDARYMGSGSDTISMVLSRLENAQSVRNTFIFFGVPEFDVTFSSYPQQEIDRIKDHIKNFLLEGRQWTDIVSQDVVNSKRINWLGFLEELRKEEEEKAIAALDRYRIRRLNESYPVVNFMILQYGDDDKEVIFGWGHHSKDPSGKAFLSRNPKLIETFDRYWKVLEEDSSPFDPHPQASRPISPVDITGLWFRVAYDTDDISWNASDGVPTEKAKFHNWALIKISIEEHRKIVVTGRRFEYENGSWRSLDDFKAKATSLENLRLWFSTDSARPGNLHVAGWYRFIHPQPAGKTNTAEGDQIHEFYGEFLNLGKEPEDRKFKKLLLFGKKIFDDKDKSDPLKDFPSAPEAQIALLDKYKQWWEGEEEQSNWPFNQYQSAAPPKSPSSSSSPPAGSVSPSC